MEQKTPFISNKRLAVFAAIFAFIGLTTTFIISAAPNAYACGGAPGDDPGGGMYDEPRVFLESQAWWQPTISGSEDFGHVHVATCFPRTHMQDGSINKIDGEITFNVRVMFHNNPGTLRSVRLQVTDNADNQEMETIKIDEECTTQSSNWNEKMQACVWWRTMTIDTTRANYDGYQEFRFSPRVDEPNGDEMRASTGWQAYLANGKTVRHHRDSGGEPREFIEARGWYDGAEYTNARLASRLPHEVSGVWEPSVSLDEGSGGVDVEHHFVSVDPNFHHGNKGIVVKDGSGSYRGKIQIDTTQFSDGWHKLFMRADAPCDGSSGNDCGTKSNGEDNNVSTNSGAIVIPFFVNNGGGSTGGGDDTPPNPDDDVTDPVDEVDTEAPLTELEQPNDGDTVSGDVQLQALASDNTAVTEVRFIVDGQVVASKATAPYTHTLDTTRMENGQHSLQSEAFDAAENSSRSSEVTINVQNQITPPDGDTGGTGEELVFVSVADSQVKNYYPTRNYGDDDELRSVTYGGKQIESYLKFNVAGLQATPQKVVLRLYVTDKSKQAGPVYATNNGWQEDSITWDTRPEKGALLGELGAVAEGEWIEYDISDKAYVTSDGSYSFVLSKDTTDSVYYDSNDGQNKPQLTITR